MHVARHPFEPEIVANRARLDEKSLASYRKDIESGNYLLFRGIERISRENVHDVVALQRPIDEQLRALDLFVDASLAKYQMATNVGRPVRIDFLGTQYEVVADDNDYSVSLKNWSLGYLAALARRRMPIVHAFCQIDLDLVARKTKTKIGAYNTPFARFLQRLFVKGEPHGKNLLAVADEIRQDAMPEALYDHALRIDGSLVDTFTSVLTQDATRFNASLLVALERYKSYWSTKQVNYPDGLISLPLTALVVMAKDHDLDVVHTSDYLVRALTEA
jgi:hypothetical protein